MRRSHVTKSGRVYWHQHFEGLNDLVRFFPYMRERKDKVKGSRLSYTFSDELPQNTLEKNRKVFSDRANKITSGSFGDESMKKDAKRLEQFSTELEDILISNTKDLDQHVEHDLRFGSRFNATQFLLGSETPFSTIVESDEALSGVGRHVTVWVNTEMLLGMSSENLFWLVASGVAVCKTLRKFGYNTQVCGYTLGYCSGCDAMQTYEIIPFGEEFDYMKIVALAIRPDFLTYIWNGYMECPYWNTGSYGGGRSLRKDEESIYGMQNDIVMMSNNYFTFNKDQAVKSAQENLKRYILK